jgi:hypothetical protein
LNALPKLVIGGKKDTISNNTKLPNSQTDLRIEGIEVVSFPKT